MARTRLLVPPLIAVAAGLALWLWPESPEEPRPEEAARSRRARITHTGRELPLGSSEADPGPDPEPEGPWGLSLRSPSLPEEASDSAIGEPGLLYVSVLGPGADRARIHVSCEDTPPQRGRSVRSFQLAAHELCRVYAYRKDGALQARSAFVDLELWPGESLSLELFLPEEQVGGLGIEFAEHDEGIEVVAVRPGSPAEAFGLEPGDVIVEVDGVTATDLDQDQFIETMTGPTGSEVMFVVTWEGDTGLVFEELLLERAQLL